MKIEVREASLEQIDVWLHLRGKLWARDNVLDLETEIKKLVEDASAKAFLAFSGEKALGFVEGRLQDSAVGCRHSPVGTLTGWYVASPFRERGVGRKLVRRLGDWFRASGCKEMAADSNLSDVKSIMAFGKVGFKETTRRVFFKKRL